MLKITDEPEVVLAELAKSKFRASFKLPKYLVKYVDEKGLDAIEGHAYDFINKRLKPAKIVNDGRQTPMKNHPVFIAQHATATCCRGCLMKWYGILKGRELTEPEVEAIVGVIMAWVRREHNFHDIMER
ncbi:DUF4186 domain-containing protein [Candidatus Saccharibacteria bacterium]|nr:DUF4186 domain-containing protein [Candidatus Saccharibacteria bacterium]